MFWDEGHIKHLLCGLNLDGGEWIIFQAIVRLIHEEARISFPRGKLSYDFVCSPILSAEGSP